MRANKTPVFQRRGASTPVKSRILIPPTKAVYRLRSTDTIRKTTRSTPSTGVHNLVVFRPFPTRLHRLSCRKLPSAKAILNRLLYSEFSNLPPPEGSGGNFTLTKYPKSRKGQEGGRGWSEVGRMRATLTSAGVYGNLRVENGLRHALRFTKMTVQNDMSTIFLCKNCGTPLTELRWCDAYSDAPNIVVKVFAQCTNSNCLRKFDFGEHTVNIRSSELYPPTTSPCPEE